MSHAEDVVGLLDHLGGEHPAAQARNINAKLLDSFYGVRARGLAIGRSETGGEHLVISAPAHGLAEETLRHRAAAHVAGANKEDGLHSTMR